MTLVPDPDSAPPRIRLHRERFPGRPIFDTAISHAMLRRVASGAAPESLRLYDPDDAVLFSSLDARRPGFDRARERAAQAGFDEVIRLAGGHAAVFLRQSMAFAWAIPDPEANLHIRPRFERLASLVVRALRRLGLDARMGELPGEYCPGEYSVNLGGRLKVMGVGQRVIRGGAHVGGVLTVGQTAELRAVLIPVYEALGLELRPEAAGGLADVEPGLTVEDVISSFLEALAEEGCEVETTGLDSSTRRAAEALVPLHAPAQSGGRGAAARSADLRSADAKTLLQADRLVRSSPSDGSPGRSEPED
ncbi:MAG TPA: lipoate--protein ligase family protein [Myxococcota bacterium]|nr:lipoate--protein ligase family protein [Myxococcota bacterium]